MFPGAIRCEKSCCHYCLFGTAAYNSDFAEVLVPLKAVKVSVLLDAGVSRLDLQLTYTNLDATSPIETTFEFPIDEATILSQLVAIIDDRVVEAVVKEKENAKNIYNDAMAAGNAAVFAEKKVVNRQEVVVMMVGNLKPGQTAEIHV
jgi:hypothetical protein